MDLEQWRPIVAELNASWPDQPISPETAVVWFTDLAHLDDRHVRTAVRALRRTSHFRPVLADILAEAEIQRRRREDVERVDRQITAPEPEGPTVSDEAREALRVEMQRVGLMPSDARKPSEREVEAERRRQLAEGRRLGLIPDRKEASA